MYKAEPYKTTPAVSAGPKDVPHRLRLQPSLCLRVSNLLLVNFGHAPPGTASGSQPEKRCGRVWLEETQQPVLPAKALCFWQVNVMVTELQKREKKSQTLFDWPSLSALLTEMCFLQSSLI